jgi:Subtilase family
MIRQLIDAPAADFSDLIPKRVSAVGPTEKLLLFDAIKARLQEKLNGFTGKFCILSIPLFDWQVSFALGPDLAPLDRLVISVSVPDLEALKQFRKAFDDNLPFYGIGTDISLEDSDYFCPGTIDQLLFGNRSASASLTNSKMLAEQGMTGAHVNIVVIDEGFDKTKVANFGGGLVNLNRQPGMTVRGHGLMMVRNIVANAPDAIFYDVPLIPQRISDLGGFLVSALHVFHQLRSAIRSLRQLPDLSGPWVLVNAWAIFDRSQEFPRGDYTENPNHPLNLVVNALADDGVDIVFAAGNCGQFCPDRRCGNLDIGPGHSIYGANSHRRVLSVGAVRTDALWVGSSSQGPGQPCLSRHKPDLCAPSYFREDKDAFNGNLGEPFVGETGSPYIASTGTSAACAMAAGIVGAIRSGWDQTVLPPDKLRLILNKSARKISGTAWNERLGHGVIDVKTTLNALAPSSNQSTFAHGTQASQAISIGSPNE